MAGPHPSECAHADPGSLCDCDCAGAQHAIARTKGGVSAAGAVSRRAQRVAAREGRPAVVNRLAEPNDADRHRASGRKGNPPGPGDRTPSGARAPMLSPTTAAKADATRRTLPADKAAWEAAALRKPSDAELAGLRKDVDKKTRAWNKARAAQDDHYTKATQALFDAQARERDAGLHTRWNAAGEQVPIPDQQLWERAQHSVGFNDPAYGKLKTKTDKAYLVMSEAESALVAAQAGNQLPLDAGSGLRMPTPELHAHLDAVIDVGRHVLDDARREAARTAGPDVAAARRDIDAHTETLAAREQLSDGFMRLGTIRDGKPGSFTFTHPDGRRETVTGYARFEELEREYADRLTHTKAKADAGRRTIAGHEQRTLLAMLGQARGFGGVHHHQAKAGTDTESNALAPRPDWQQRLHTAETFFPDAWLTRHADAPLTVGASQRAYYSGHRNFLSMSAPGRDNDFYVGGFADETDEVSVHELGHRMETLIPGLTALEFTLVRRHATAPDGTVEPIAALTGGGYEAHERAQKDHWGNGYAGKSYEHPDRPDTSAWEIFQVGLQDTFGRGHRRYGRPADPDELPAFVIGALLTLGR